MTAQDVVTDALVIIGELGRGQTPNTEELQHGLDVLNGILDIWSTERLSLHKVKRVRFTLVPGQQDYTIGPTGADFTNERPVLIQTATIVLGT